MLLTRGELAGIIRMLQGTGEDFSLLLRDNFSKEEEGYRFNREEIKINSKSKVIEILTKNKNMETWIEMVNYDKPYIKRLMKGNKVGRIPLTFLREEEQYKVHRINIKGKEFNLDCTGNKVEFLRELVSVVGAEETLVVVGELKSGKTVEIILKNETFMRKFVSEDWKQIILFENDYDKFKEFFDGIIIKEILRVGIEQDKVVGMEEYFSHINEREFKHAITK